MITCYPVIHNGRNMFKKLFLWLIRLYWRMVPEHRRPDCLFRVTCSQYVYDVTKEFGFISGVKALYTRWRTCRPGYHPQWINGELGLLLADGSWVNAFQVRRNILTPFQRTSNNPPSLHVSDGLDLGSMRATSSDSFRSFQKSDKSHPVKKIALHMEPHHGL